MEEEYSFGDSEEESRRNDPEDPGTAGVGPSEPAPPEQVTPEPKKTKRKTTPRSARGFREIRKNAKGQDCGFDLCTQSVENIQGIAALMKDQIETAREGYEYLIDTTYQALTAAGGIEIHELVGYIERHSQSGRSKEMEDRIEELERDLRMEKVMSEGYQETAWISREVALESNTRAKEVTAAAAKVWTFLENTGEVVVATNLFKEGLETAKDFASPNL